MSEYDDDPIQSGKKKGFFKDMILGSDEEYEEYIKASNTTNIETGVNLNNATYTKNNISGLENHNYNIPSNNAVVIKSKDALINWIISIICIIVVAIAARLYAPSNLGGTVSYDDAYTEPAMDYDTSKIINNGGVIANYAYNEVLTWNLDNGSLTMDIPTYYSFAKEDNVICSAVYHPDKRVNGTGTVFDIEIEYESLNLEALSKYEEALKMAEGYKEFLSVDGNRTVYVKNASNQVNMFVIRENSTFTYGICVGDYQSLLDI